MTAHQHASRARAENPLSRATRWVILGEAAFLFFMGLSVLLHPGFVLAKREGGISEYGVHIKTALLYTAAWAVLAVANVRAARELDERHETSAKMRKVLFGYTAAILLVLLSTYVYSLDTVMRYIHYALGATLIVFMSWASYWLYRLRAKSPLARTLLWAQVLGSLAALMSILGVIHVLFAAETLSNVGCAVILATTLHHTFESSLGPPLESSPDTA
jgi:hypothetical protein